MQNGSSVILQSLDRHALTPIARQSTGRASLQIHDWRVSQLGGGAGNPVSVGLYRVEGSGQDGAEPLAWSVILKVIQSPANLGLVNMGEGDDPAHWNYWKRELLVYQSGLLDRLPAGLVAPHCYHQEERPGSLAMLWLEDIYDDARGGWKLERYVLTARRLGRWNGMHLSSAPTPGLPWLSQHRNRQWIAFVPDWRAFPWDHPRVLQRYPVPGSNPFRAMLLENERFLERLERLPKSICHGDTYPTNFMARRQEDGQEQTVALDWALMGYEPVGDDLGQLVFGAHNSLTDHGPAEITQTLFEAYLDGLHDSGCQVDRQETWFGFTAAAALRVGLFQLVMLAEAIRQTGTENDAQPDRSSPPECFEVTMAKEAYRLLEAG